jgi:hypothetical protein
VSKSSLPNIPGMNAWNRFWFAPSDPTNIGFIRIMFGALILYVHLAYIPDISNFFGEHAWFDLNSATKERKEFPSNVQPIGWEASDGVYSDDKIESVRLPDALNRRKAVIDFYHSLPANRQDRDKALAFFNRIYARSNPDDFRACLDLMLQLSQSLPEDKALHRESLINLLFPTGAVQRQISSNLPEFIKTLPTEERGKLVDEILAFGEALPADLDELSFVVGYFQIAVRTRVGQNQVWRYMRNLPTDEAEKKEAIDYLNRWDCDPRDPDLVYARGRPTFSFFFHSSNLTAMSVFHAIGCTFIVLFTIGLFTRVSSVFTWFFLLNFLHRTTQVLFGMDAMMMILMTYLVIGDSGQSLSIDRMRARYRAAKALAQGGGRSIPWAEAVLAGPARTWTANLGTRLIQVHFCYIYASSGLSKLKGTMWWNHEAMWPTIANPEFCPVQFKAYEWLLRQLFEYKAVYYMCGGGVALFTLALEIGLPFLIWNMRLRPYLVIGAILLHTGIGIIMGLTIFGCLMLCLLSSYIPAAVIRNRVTWANAKGERLKLRYSSEDDGQVRLAAVIKTFDVAQQVELQVGKKEDLALTTGDGNVVRGEEVGSTARQKLVMLQGFWLLRLIPGFGLFLSSLFRLPKSDENSKASTTPTVSAS